MKVLAAFSYLISFQLTLLLFGCTPKNKTPLSTITPIDYRRSSIERVLKALTTQKSSCAEKKNALRLKIDLHDSFQFLKGESDRISQRMRTLRQRLRPYRNSSALLEEFKIYFKKTKCHALRQFAKRAIRLLQADKEKRIGPNAFTISNVYKEFELRGGELQANARLRLIDWCEDAIRQALRPSSSTDPRIQENVFFQCLYPLYESDPRYYFASDPVQRPPDPALKWILDDLKTKLLKLKSSRFSLLAKEELDFDKTFFLEENAHFIGSFDIQRLKIPLSTQGRAPKRNQTLVFVSDYGYRVDHIFVPNADRHALEQAIARRFRFRKSRSLAVLALTQESLIGIFEVARAARRQGASELDLSVRRLVASKAPLGDIHTKHAKGLPLYRRESLSVSIRLFSPHKGEISRLALRQFLFDPNAKSQLKRILFDGDVVILPNQKRIFITQTKALRRELDRMHTQAKDRVNVILGIKRDTTYQRLIDLISILRFKTYSSKKRISRFFAIAIAPYHQVFKLPADVFNLTKPDTKEESSHQIEMKKPNHK